MLSGTLATNRKQDNFCYLKMGTQAAHMAYGSFDDWQRISIELHATSGCPLLSPVANPGPNRQEHQLIVCNMAWRFCISVLMRVWMLLVQVSSWSGSVLDQQPNITTPSHSSFIVGLCPVRAGRGRFCFPPPCTLTPSSPQPCSAQWGAWGQEQDLCQPA